MTLNEFKTKWLGKPCDWDGSYGNQCVDLYRFYVNEVLHFPQSPGVGGAAEIWDSADPDYYDFILNTPMGIPQPGDIVIWNRKMGGGMGHVAIALDGSTVTTLKLLETDGTTGTGLVQLKDRSYTNVIGWLHPKENMGNELEVCLRDRQKFWDERDDLLRTIGAGSVEEGKSMVAGFKSRITDLTNQLGSAQAEVKNREEQVSRLKTEVIALTEQLKERTDQLNIFAKEKGELAVQVETLKVQVETLKQQQTQGEVTLTFGELIKLLLQQKITIKK
jgi:polyhydroxyalkanoate synthesis regulator phasin